MPAKILVVDDQTDVRDMLIDHLAAQGYVVTHTLNADEALHSVRRDQPQLVLLDVGLPSVNGLEVLRRICRDYPTVGVIMITGNPDITLARTTLQMGAIDYLFKPFDMDRVTRAVRLGVEVVRELLEKRQPSQV
jgi:two-component system nitrogen regulation response regulator NtrX